MQYFFQKMTRLIEWNADVLRLLKQIAAAEAPQKRHTEDVAQTSSTTGKKVLDEVTDIISLPKFNAKQPRN
jgi:hypothetical protein